MINQKLWEIWAREWNRGLCFARNRNWQIEPLKIHEPIKHRDIEVLEQEQQFNYPEDFKTVLTQFASGVEFYWAIEGEYPPKELKEVFSSSYYLWSFAELKRFRNYSHNVWETFPDLNDPFDQVWYNKAPFIQVPNGDLIAFDLSNATKESPIVYLDHEGGEFHGKRLAENFVSFIEKWTHLYAVGPESWQLEPFYDYEKNELSSSSPIIDQWRSWLEC